MSLRLQLLAFGLLTLVLPWAGLRVIVQMEAGLRNGLESALLASAGTVAAALTNSEFDGFRVAADSTEAATIYAHSLREVPRIDGFQEDWVLNRTGVGPAASEALTLGNEAVLWAGNAGRYVYLYVEVTDDDLVYQSSPGESPYGDRLALLLPGGSAIAAALLLATSAPGTFRAQATAAGRFAPDGRFEDRVVAAWRATSRGYAVEVQLPLAMIGSRLGVAVIDVDRGGGGFAVSLAASWQAEAIGGAFVRERNEMSDLLARFSRQGDRYRALSADGWVLADTGAIVDAPVLAPIGAGLTDRFFRFLLRRNDPLYDGLENPRGRLADQDLREVLLGRPATAWYRQGPEGRAVVAAAVPLSGPNGNQGAVLLEQASDSVLTLADQALTRLMLTTMLVSVAAALLLLGYASFLSFRVGRLAQAAESALGPRGEIRAALPGSRSQDEIGALTRSFESLLGRLQDYTAYLRTLSSKLTHELRTPLAIVTTSLDNLEHEVDTLSGRDYMARLRQGAGRLDAILNSMGAATRVEQAVNEMPRAALDVAAVTGAAVDAYRDVYPDRRFELKVPGEPCMVDGSVELIAQLLDKLVDNAVGFSTGGGQIDVSVANAADGYELAVANEGPPLPAAMRYQLFDSLVSVRSDGDGNRPHLGLGLYIVAAIAKAHGGQVAAENRSDGRGVVVRVCLPRLR